MSIPLTGSNGLFTRLGKIFKFDRLQQTYQASVPGALDAIMQQYATPDRPAVAALPTLSTPNRLGCGNIFGAQGGTQQSAVQTLLSMVADDQPARATTLAAALTELIRQMNGSSDSVKACTVSASASALGTNKGNGAVLLATKRGDGLVQENIVAEVAPILCTADAQTGGATIGNESWQFAGQPDDGQTSLDTWPTGSGANASITGISAFQNNAGGNLLTNSDFETWSGSPLALANWTLTVGTWGTDIVREGSTVYTQTYSAKIPGNAGGTGVLASMQQEFGNSGSGTAGVLLPDRSYAVNFFAKFDVVPAAGVLTIELVDGSGTVIQDDQGNNNSTTFSCHSMATSWAACNTLFRLPRLLPATIRLRFRVSTAISSGSNLFVDDLALGFMTALYAGGPSIAIFSGSTQWVAGDGFTIGTTNSRGGASYLSTFQAMFDKFFGMRALGLLLPSAGSPTIADTLITS